MFAALALVVMSAASVEAEPLKPFSTSVSFGIVPQQSASKLARRWVPFTEYLSTRTGYRVGFATAPDIPAFERRLASGEYDVAYMNPYHYTVFHAVPGYVAFAKEKDKKIQGVLVVRKDSPLTGLKDLAGQRVAFPSPAAFAASVLPQAYLHKAGIAIIPNYVESHDSVYRAVAMRLYPAGGGVVRTFEAMSAEVTEQLKIFWTSEFFTPHAFAAHPRLKAGVVARLREEMEGMADNEEGRRLLDALSFKGIAPATDSDWDDVRGLGIDVLDPLGGE